MPREPVTARAALDCRSAQPPWPWHAPALPPSALGTCQGGGRLSRALWAALAEVGAGALEGGDPRACDARSELLSGRVLERHLAEAAVVDLEQRASAARGEAEDADRVLRPVGAAEAELDGVAIHALHAPHLQAAVVPNREGSAGDEPGAVDGEPPGL